MVIQVPSNPITLVTFEAKFLIILVNFFAYVPQKWLMVRVDKATTTSTQLTLRSSIGSPIALQRRWIYTATPNTAAYDYLWFHLEKSVNRTEDGLAQLFVPKMLTNINQYVAEFWSSIQKWFFWILLLEITRPQGNMDKGIFWMTKQNSFWRKVHSCTIFAPLTAIWHWTNWNYWPQCKVRTKQTA